MTDDINPSHYKDGPFECIELTRLLSFDWGNVVKYCFRWQHKNGVEDLKKACWYADDAIREDTPFHVLYVDHTLRGYRLYAPKDEANIRLTTLVKCDWMGLTPIWTAMLYDSLTLVPQLLRFKIKEVEKEGK